MIGRIEIGEDVGPFAWRGKRDGTAPLAAREAFGRHKLNARGFSALYRASERQMQFVSGPAFFGLQRLLSTPAGDTDVESDARAMVILHGVALGECQSADRGRLADRVCRIEPA